MRKLTLSALLAATLLASPLVSAQNLTDADLQRWMTSARVLQQSGIDRAATEASGTAGANSALKDPATMFSRMVAESRKTGHYGEMKSVLEKQGYSSPEQWASVGDRVAVAYSAIHLQQAGNINPAQMDQAMLLLQNTPNLPPQMKAQLEKGMTAAKNMSAAARNAPPADIELMRRNKSTLDAFFKSAGNTQP